MKLLYAEDEISMSEAVVDVLTYHKYNVDAVYNGADALAYAEAEQYDGMILDIMMPELSGLEVLEQLRKKGNNTPILLLTAKVEIEDRIQGLDMGADDYLPKPFAMGELLARVRAMLRRKENFTPDILKVGNLTLNMQSYELSCNGQSFVLPKLEYQLMELLMLLFWTNRCLSQNPTKKGSKAGFGQFRGYWNKIRGKFPVFTSHTEQGT